MHDRPLKRFQAKWVPVRVKKTRQTRNLEPRFDSIETEKALGIERAARFYFGTPDDRIMGGGGLGNGGGAGMVGGAAAGPVLLQVGGTFVVPTGAVYEPTDGAVTVP